MPVPQNSSAKVHSPLVTALQGGSRHIGIVTGFGAVAAEVHIFDALFVQVFFYFFLEQITAMVTAKCQFHKPSLAFLLPELELPFSLGQPQIDRRQFPGRNGLALCQQ